MRTSKPRQHCIALTGCIMAFTTVAPLPATAQDIANYTPVTEARLLKPEAENWLHYRGNFEGWGYSPLDKITPDNVRMLQPVWTLSTGVVEGHQAPPFVNNGVMFVTTPGNQVLALNAKTGDIIWRYKRELPEDIIQSHPTSRGVGLFEDKVYIATLDAFVVALDAKTGKVVWETRVDDYRRAYYFTLAPLVAKGKVMVGTSGGEFGIRGYVAALDARTGKEIWRTYTIPAPGEPGHDTWKDGDHWKTGGGSVWITGHYDPKLNLVYWGTGNPGPWVGDMHPGDSLYTASVVALDADTGKLRAYHQYVPNESWDWDEVSAPLLIEYTRKGRTIPGLVHPGRNGYLWLLERQQDAIKFVDAKPFVKQEVFTAIDPVTGRPSWDESKKPATGKSVTFCPSHWGGKDWPPAAWNPKTRLLYVPAQENLCSTLKSDEKRPEYEAGKRFVGTDAAATRVFRRAGANHIGELQAWNLETGEKVWTFEYPHINWGPVLTTGGGLVFAGGSSDRMFRAFDAKTGKVLWQFRANSGITAVPVSYMVDGVQYIAVQAGWGVDAQKMIARLDQTMGTTTHVPQGGVIWVFAVRN
ncbi:MAG TPA: PQQ-dependent dehydrogenase, methanol/ethanol family [Burkholderiales bacterium]|nr:PQQ-dependent dehydrogenase, methanol/ethanol family [Burkholderiales bacterium]